MCHVLQTQQKVLDSTKLYIKQSLKASSGYQTWASCSHKTPTHYFCHCNTYPTHPFNHDGVLKPSALCSFLCCMTVCTVHTKTMLIHAAMLQCCHCWQHFQHPPANSQSELVLSSLNHCWVELEVFLCGATSFLICHSVMLNIRICNLYTSLFHVSWNWQKYC